MARRSILTAIENDPALSQSWQPEAMIQAQAHIKEQLNRSAEIQVPLSAIHLTFSFTPSQSALRYHYDLKQISQWAEAEIRQNGIRSPLWVRPLPGYNSKTPAYELIAGMRRYLAAQHLELETVPVKVFDWSDEQAYQAAASENFNRKSFTPIEELDHILNFLSQSLNLAIDEVPALLNRMSNASKGNIDPVFLKSDAAQTVEQVFSALGQMSWKTFVQSRLRLRNQPADIIEAIREGKLSYPKAMAIASIKNETSRVSLIEQAVVNELTLEAITAAANDAKRTTAETSTTKLQTEEQVFKSLTSTVMKKVRTSKLEKTIRKKVERLLKQIEDLLESTES
jgi:ParB family chromosome partitioning protein